MTRAFPLGNSGNQRDLEDARRGHKEQVVAQEGLEGHAEESVVMQTLAATAEDTRSPEGFSKVI